jgi:predicted DsbA family dithiol-disulfide isomerase
LEESAALRITVVPTIIIGQRRIEGVATEGVIIRALEESAVDGAA